MKVAVFGKNGCDLCKNRLEVAEKTVGHIKREDVDVEYFDVETPEGLTELSFLGAGTDIPVVALLDDDDEVVESWVGPTDVMTTKSLITAINGG